MYILKDYVNNSIKLVQIKKKKSHLSPIDDESLKIFDFTTRPWTCISVTGEILKCLTLRLRPQKQSVLDSAEHIFLDFFSFNP